MHVALAIGGWKDPGAWGIALADLTRHIARAYRESLDVDDVGEAKILARIHAFYNAEHLKNTSPLEGGLVPPKDD
jgi:hypothetical protein